MIHSLPEKDDSARPSVVVSQLVWFLLFLKNVFRISLDAGGHKHLCKSSENFMIHHSASSFDMWQSFPCSWEGKNMLSISPLLSSSERGILGEDVGWNTGQSLSSSSSLHSFSAVFPHSIVGPTWPVNWLSKLKMTVPGLWTWTGPTETKRSKECTLFYLSCRSVLTCSLQSGVMRYNS